MDEEEKLDERTRSLMEQLYNPEANPQKLASEWKDYLDGRCKEAIGPEEDYINNFCNYRL